MWILYVVQCVSSEIDCDLSRMYPAFHSMTVGIGSSTPMTHNRISGLDTGWMDGWTSMCFLHKKRPFIFCVKNPNDVVKFKLNIVSNTFHSGKITLFV